MIDFGFSRLTPEVIWTLGLVFAVLVISTLILFGLKRWKPGQDFNELSLRIRTWWIIVGLFAASFVFHQATCILFFALVSFLALREYFSLVPIRDTDQRVLLWAYLAIPVQYFWVYIEWYGMFIVFIPVYMFLLLPARTILTGNTDGLLKTMGVVHWGVMATVFSLSHAAMFLAFEPGASPHAAANWPSEAAEVSQNAGAGLLLLLLALTQANDVAQFIWGKLFGKKKIVPKVSPGKTIVGFVGGVATTMVLAGLVGPYLTVMDLPHALIAGMILGVGGFLGDITISGIKRDLGVKDSGNLLPGHGGILDRVDSLTVTAPLLFHFVYYFYG